jgi:hypothetical protein
VSSSYWRPRVVDHSKTVRAVMSTYWSGGEIAEGATLNAAS